MKAPPPLSDDLRALVEVERELDEPAPATRQRMFARLAPLVFPPSGGGGAGPGDGAPPAGSTGGGPGSGLGAGAGAAGAGALAATSTWRAKVLLSLLSATIGAAGGAATHAWVAAPKPAPVVLAPVEATATGSAASAPVEPTAEPEPEPEPAPAAPASARPEDRPRGAASLRSERLLLETANAALVRGDHASAIATLKRHAALYPKGELAQEREALLVQALAASGDDAAAQQRAKEFKKKFPKSLQQTSVDRATRPE